MTISKGSKVYRVVEYDPPQEMTPHTWMIAEREVQAVHKNGDIMLVSPFTEKRHYEKHALGLYFFADPADAVRDFVVKQRRNAESAQNMLRESSRAVKWAETWAQQNATGLKLVKES